MSEISSNDYTKYYDNLVVIGNGAYGVVYKGREIETNELRAIKVIQFDKVKESILLTETEVETTDPQIKFNETINEYEKECEIMKDCSNINSVKFYTNFKDENSIAIIMELCESNLLQLLLKKGTEGFSIKEIYEILNQLNNAFQTMKEKKIIHRDLKLENILMKYEDKNKFIIKLADYGTSKRLDSLSKNYCNTTVGTLVYMSPEILKREKYNYKCDLWSLGVIIYRLKFVKSPFSGQSETALISNINNFNNKSLKKTGNEELDDLIKKLLEKDYEKRLSWEEYFDHPFFEIYAIKIKIIYYIKEEKDTLGRDNNIFGEKFVENNKYKIKLKINGISSKLVQNYELKYGENNIEIIIKNNITNFEQMFYQCISLKNIEGLKDLEVMDGYNFSNMFYECESLTDIKALENWNVSKGKDFSNMFFGCKSLTDIKSIENWNVSNGNNFSNIFSWCESLTDIKPLEKWNVSNGKNFSDIFNGCKSLINIKALEKWDVSNGNDFSNMFFGCKSLLEINSLENWNVSKGHNFSGMFSWCLSLTDLKPLEKWDVSNGNNFSNMFFGCKFLSNIKALKNWNVSNGINFSNMFFLCKSLSDIKSLENWNVSNGTNYSEMFSYCESLTEIKALEKWNVSKGNDFSEMFYWCSSLTNIKALKNWNVSNGNNFSSMFFWCSSLSDIKPLENWNVSNGNNFSNMFFWCLSLSDSNSLEKWNVSNGNNFLNMFHGCKSLTDIKPLEKWNISKSNFNNLF